MYGSGEFVPGFRAISGARIVETCKGIDREQTPGAVLDMYSPRYLEIPRRRLSDDFELRLIKTSGTNGVGVPDRRACLGKVFAELDARCRHRRHGALRRIL